MIEMRWLKIDYPPPSGVNPAAIPDSSGKFCRVLQYRHKLREFTEKEYVVSVWSDWIDVPTVEETK